MPSWGPISRRELIHYLRQLGFEGPFPGGKHEFMVRGGRQRITLPNPHRGDINVHLLAAILRKLDMEREQWERL